MAKTLFLKNRVQISPETMVVLRSIIFRYGNFFTAGHTTSSYILPYVANGTPEESVPAVFGKPLVVTSGLACLALPKSVV